MAAVAFIGAGKMAEALLSGVVRSGVFSAGQVKVSDIDPARLSLMGRKYGVLCSADNASAAADADCVVFAVKPQDIDAALVDVAGAGCGSGTVFVSMAAGVKVSRIQSALGGNSKVFRVMPNLPVVESEGACVVYGRGAEDDFAMVGRIFGAVGIVEFVEQEGLIDAFTALSGSGPGFVAAFTESLISGAEKLGLSPAVAEKFAVQTVFGSAKIMREGASPGDLREAVSSPAGTTVAGLEEFEKSGFSSIVENALAAAYKRSKELA